MNLLTILSGKKTYIVAFVAATVGLLQAFGVEIPASVLTILAAAGITTTRMAIAKAAQ